MLMEFYSLGYGHFLVFRFDGCLPSQFHVLIFNKTATEIDYPLRRTPPLNSNRKLKKEYRTQEANDDDDDESVINNLDSSDSDNNVKCSSIKEKGYDRISPEARKNLKKKLSVIKSEYPNFKTIMYPTHVRYRYNLGVNFSHASTYFARDKSDKVILKGPNGKNYRVGLYLNQTTAKFTDGWKDFVVDNGLNVGDGCMFELVKRPPNNVYQVSIFRI
ncbi:hypothetical protein SOVF_091120 [Spinacia oleracea]|nr:hypothetical protein SOVF_091120 [Spinacia oleracea]